jgi:hypothetical protein
METEYTALTITLRSVTFLFLDVIRNVISLFVPSKGTLLTSKTTVHGSQAVKFGIRSDYTSVLILRHQEALVSILAQT